MNGSVVFTERERERGVRGREWGDEGRREREREREREVGGRQADKLLL